MYSTGNYIFDLNLNSYRAVVSLIHFFKKWYFALACKMYNLKLRSFILKLLIIVQEIGYVEFLYFSHSSAL
jgi:hypothetical protein